MARMTKAEEQALSALILYLIVIGIIISPAAIPIWWVQTHIKQHDMANALSFAIGIAYPLIVISFFAYKSVKKRRQDDRSEAIAMNIIATHREALGLQCAHKLRTDSYGTEDSRKWDQEIRHFFDTQLASISHHKPHLFFRKCIKYIDVIGRDERNKIEQDIISDPDAFFTPDMSMYDFKTYCGAILKKAGWEVDIVGSSGNQGADIIARKGQKKLVFQCKIYKKRAVGTAAVQQAQGAKLYHQADSAVVVGDTGFSEAAEALAEVSRVILIDHRQLKKWAELF